MRILIAEDERDLNSIIEQKLKKHGYSVDACFNGMEAIDFIDMAEYDAIILDVMMPKADGFYVLEKLRERGKTTPVIFLTAKDSVADRVKGLDSGANDYIVKPFSFDELLARIRAVTRASFNMTSNVLKIDDLELDCASHTVKRAGKEIILSSKEFALLEYLMRNKGIVLSRELIENHIWGFEYEGGTNVVDVYISYLRKKIDGASDKKLIRTIRGSGYTIKGD